LNILVTGGAGYIGSMTCKELQKQGHQVFVYDNLTNSKASFTKWGELVVGDLLDKELLHATLAKNKIEAVFHFAALIEVGESAKNPLKFHLNNVVGTHNLLTGMVEAGVKHIVFSSSCATYGNAEKMPISEDNIQQPVSVYGETKLYCEKMIRDLTRIGQMHAVVLRYFNASGADPDGESGECHHPETHLIPLVIQAVYDKNFELKIFGKDYPTPDGTCIRDYAHVTDLAVAHAKALDWSVKTKEKFESFNLGSGKGSSVLEVIRAVETHTKGKVKSSFHPRREGDADVLVADISKAKRLLGWEPTLSKLENVVTTACRWHSKNEHN
jgi:UDP-glucose-4-epimerase GalE